MEDYQETIDRVLYLLDTNEEWNQRYLDYVVHLQDTKFNELYKGRNFNLPHVFNMHITISTAANGTSVYPLYDIRFRGYSVATIKVFKKKKYIDDTRDVRIKIKKPCESFMKELIKQDYDCRVYDEIPKEVYIPWLSAHGKNFRQFFINLDNAEKNHKIQLKNKAEAKIESMMLELMSNKRKPAGFQNTALVKMANKGMFQMPTPLAASNAYKGAQYINYSGKNSGGIDILARVGKGKPILTIMELKAKNRGYQNSAENTIRQAIAYATFIWKLVRDDRQGAKWWKFFGFNGSIPDPLTIKACIVMPYEEGTRIFRNEFLAIGERDRIHLCHFYAKSDGSVETNIFEKANI